jgi:hypothetical protein
MEREEALALIKQLESATYQKLITWESTPETGTFLTTAGGFPVTISEGYKLSGSRTSAIPPPPQESVLSFYVLTVYNEENKVVDLVRGSYPAATKQEGFLSVRLRNLYFAARRDALKSAQVLGSIFTALNAKLKSSSGPPTSGSHGLEGAEELPGSDWSDLPESEVDSEFDAPGR